MRHIVLDALLSRAFAGSDGERARQRLRRAHIRLAKMTPAERKTYTRDNGPTKWKPIKDRFTSILGKKCWYTEVELIGAPLVVDHFRPVCSYWWLSFEAANYRVSCPWANSPAHNARHGCAGGKGDSFPLLPPGVPARGRNQLRIESPAILDPCNSADCDLVVFQADGRPVVNPEKAQDPIAVQRVDQSMLLLNLDHPEFNSKREQLCRAIAGDVGLYEALPEGSPARQVVVDRIEDRLAPTAPFSVAAKFYLRLHRHLEWVEEVLVRV